MSKRIHISIEGNIGAGKSTVMQLLQNDMRHDTRVRFSQEEVHKWVECGFLQAMYEGSVSHQEFQYMVLTSTAAQYIQLHNSDAQVTVQERSVDATLHVFGRSNLPPGKAFDMFQFSYDQIKNCMPAKKHHRIYLKTSAKTSYKRIADRQRASESCINMNYLEKIHTRYEEWLAEDTNTTVIDGSDTPEVVMQQVKAAFDRLAGLVSIN